MLLIFGRSFSTTQEHGISPKPTYSRVKANYFSFGYFVGRVLPYQLFDLSKIPVFKQSAPSKIGQGSVQKYRPRFMGGKRKRGAFEIVWLRT